MDFVPPGVYRIDHLRDPWPWTAGLAGLFYWVAWDPKKLFGVPKAEWQRRIVAETIRLYEDEGLRDPKEISRRIGRKFDKEKNAAKAVGPFDVPTDASALISTDEAVRRVRVFSEDYLNKELDIFFSLLPDRLTSEYFASHFPAIRPIAAWSVYGHSGDITTGIDMLFMQLDTIAYSHDLSTLVALEQKIDASFEPDQFLKYCFMAAHFEESGRITPGSRLCLLVVEPVSTPADDASLRRLAISKLDQKDYPTNQLPYDRAERLASRARELVSTADFARTTWQALGDHFAGVRAKLTVDQEMLRKLIDGLLVSLRIKRSRRRGVSLFSESSR
jgi:hypothetical protein